MFEANNLDKNSIGLEEAKQLLQYECKNLKFIQLCKFLVMKGQTMF